MAFCMRCGNEMDEGINSCKVCGWNIHMVGTSSETTNKGSVRSCPNCGVTLKAFETCCPMCGSEIRDLNTSSAIKEFSRKLDELEEARKPASIGQTIASSFGLGRSDSTDVKIQNHIKMFNVPNTREDVYEFMILASTNINFEALSATSCSSVGANSLEELKSMKVTAEAWIAKATQVYQKAKLTLSKDEKYSEIEEMYKNIMAEVEAAKKKKSWNTIKMILVPAVLLMAIGLIPGGILGGMAISHANKVKRLERTVEEIQNDVANGDYDVALIKANGLYIESDDEDEEKHWDERRKAIIELIEKKKEESHD